MKQSRSIFRLIALIVCAGFAFCFNNYPASAERVASFKHGLRETEQQNETYIHQDAYTLPYFLRQTSNERTVSALHFYGGIPPVASGLPADQYIIPSCRTFVSATAHHALRYTAKLLYPKHWFW